MVLTQKSQTDCEIECDKLLNLYEHIKNKVKYDFDFDSIQPNKLKEILINMTISVYSKIKVEIEKK